jgi:hypothetical protein
LYRRCQALEEVWPKVMTGKISLDESPGRLADRHGIRRSQSLQACSDVGCFTQRQLFLSAASTHLAYHDQPSMDPQAYSQADAFILLQADVQSPHGVENAQCCPHGPLGIVFVGLRIAKIDQQAIAEILGNGSVKVLDDCSAGGLIGAHNLAQVFRVELA